MYVRIIILNESFTKLLFPLSIFTISPTINSSKNFFFTISHTESFLLLSFYLYSVSIYD